MCLIIYKHYKITVCLKCLYLSESYSIWDKNLCPERVVYYVTILLCIDMDTERTLNDVAKKDFHLPRQLSNPNVVVSNPSPNVAHNGRILVRFYPGGSLI